MSIPKNVNYLINLEKRYCFSKKKHKLFYRYYFCCYEVKNCEGKTCINKKLAYKSFIKSIK